MTLEGISGMVNLSGGENAVDSKVEQNEGWQDDLPTAFDESLNL